LNPDSVPSFIDNRVFRTDALFIRAENAVGAQSAQWLLTARAGI